jgi:hypothetical protein
MLTTEQRLHNIRTKVRLVSDRVWHKEGWGICTGDLELMLIIREMDKLAGLPVRPLPTVVVTALQS